jgi:hypothetical protein
MNTEKKFENMFHKTQTQTQTIVLSDLKKLFLDLQKKNTTTWMKK